MGTTDSGNNPSSVNWRERRLHPRIPVDAEARVYLIDLGARLSGRLVNLSFGGCRIQLQRPFPTGIYRRVEVEFSLEGIPFRLAGVTQGIYYRRGVGIRFLGVSSRKQDQLAVLLAELNESAEAANPRQQD
jgi:hypothetical protein